jgi:hypothetical protein
MCTRSKLSRMSGDDGRVADSTHKMAFMDNKTNTLGCLRSTLIDFFKRMEGKPDNYDRGARTPAIYPHDDTWNYECRRCTEVEQNNGNVEVE